jgi:transposase
MEGQETQLPKRTRSIFTRDEYQLIRELVAKFGDENWKVVAAEIPNRSTRQCKERWTSYLAPHVENGPWTLEEDRLLIQKIAEDGHKWKDFEALFPNRSAINIKNRWRHIQKRQRRHPVCNSQPPEHMSSFDRLFATSLAEDNDDFSRDGERGISSFQTLW